MKKTNKLLLFMVPVLLFLAVGNVVAEGRDIVSETIEEPKHPYGGTCEDVSHRDVLSMASQVVKGEPFRLNRGASVCKHNVELLENGNVLKISTGLGDGIRSSWNDIKKGNRRRFEFMFDRQVRINTGFQLEYSVRITKDNTFLRIPRNQYYWYWITQLHPSCHNCFPAFAVSVDRFKGISAFDYLILESRHFGAAKTDYTPKVEGKWVKIKIEFKPSHNNGFRRLWVNDQLVLNENNDQTWSGPYTNRFDLKFGIYQGTAKGTKNPEYPSIRQDNQQSVQFKDFRFQRI